MSQTREFPALEGRVVEPSWEHFKPKGPKGQENGSKSTPLGELTASRVRLFASPWLERDEGGTSSGRRRTAWRTGVAPSPPARLSEFLAAKS